MPLQDSGVGGVDISVTGRRLRKVERLTASVTFYARIEDITISDTSGVIDTRRSYEEASGGSVNVLGTSPTFQFERRAYIESTGNEPVDVLIQNAGTTMRRLAPGDRWTVSAYNFSVIIPEGRAARDTRKIPPARDGRTYWRFERED